MIWRNSFRIAMAVAAFLMAVASCYAQSGAGGGGKVRELDLQTMVERLGNFMETPEGKAAFPEIGIYDLTHPDFKFRDLCATVKSVVKDEGVEDAFGNKRDCATFVEGNVRYFKCDGRELPEFKPDNEPEFYKIVLHELFVLTEIEKPISANVPSDYVVSRRIKDNLHYEPWGEWLPGRKPFESIMSSGLWCAGGRSKLMMWDRSGQIRIAELSYAGKKVKVRVVFRGEQKIPRKSIDVSTLASNNNEYISFEEMTDPKYGRLSIRYQSNPITKSKTIELMENTELWTTIDLKVGLRSSAQGPTVSSSLTFQCQALESWLSSSLAEKLPGVFDRLSHTQKDEFEIESN